MNKFLSIVWYKVLPAVYGGQKGITQFNQALGEKADLTCLCSKNNVVTPGLSFRVQPELPVSKSQFWNLFTRKKILDKIRNEKYNHIIIEHPYHGWLGKHKQKLNFQFIVHAHNIEFVRLKKKGEWWWRIVRSMEKNAFRSADFILFKTQEDREFAINSFLLYSENCLLLPFGTELKSAPKKNLALTARIRERHRIADTESIILFSASFDYEPNRQAYFTLINEILPRLEKSGANFRIIICGSPHNLNPPASPKIIITGEVADLSEYLLAADIFINPVVTGSGIQTKNMEAISYGLPLVTTEFAAKGLPVYLLNNMVTTVQDKDWNTFSKAVISSLKNQPLANQKFYEDYNWGNIVDRFLPDIGVKT